ncbi:hypothetical protein [Streptomyces sp. NPDC091268]|uniref:hypothetical protein n=1 Tax=Streptomyces sp. NPDC091268 TaxID=3365979 RepID=UPI003819AFCA
MNRRPLVLVAATAGALATAAFALPNLPPNPVSDVVNDRLYKEKGKRFETAAQAPTRAEATWALPSWIPKDATDVRIHARTTGRARLIRFKLGETPLDGPQCAAGTPKEMARPALDAKWWPHDTRAEERAECRDVRQYQVVVRGKRVYAWTDGTPSPGAQDRQDVPALRQATNRH